jgi:hypothetical protein
MLNDRIMSILKFIEFDYGLSLKNEHYKYEITYKLFN